MSDDKYIRMTPCDSIHDLMPYLIIGNPAMTRMDVTTLKDQSALLITTTVGMFSCRSAANGMRLSTSFMVILLRWM